MPRYATRREYWTDNPFEGLPKKVKIDDADDFISEFWYDGSLEDDEFDGILTEHFTIKEILVNGNPVDVNASYITYVENSGSDRMLDVVAIVGAGRGKRWRAQWDLSSNGKYLTRTELSGAREGKDFLDMDEDEYYEENVGGAGRRSRLRERRDDAYWEDEGWEDFDPEDPETWAEWEGGRSSWRDEGWFDLNLYEFFEDVAGDFNALAKHASKLADEIEDLVDDVDDSNFVDEHLMENLHGDWNNLVQAIKSGTAYVKKHSRKLHSENVEEHIEGLDYRFRSLVETVEDILENVTNVEYESDLNLRKLKKMIEDIIEMGGEVIEDALDRYQEGWVDMGHSVASRDDWMNDNFVNVRTYSYGGLLR